jgi:hypothetical protein
MWQETVAMWLWMHTCSKCNAYFVFHLLNKSSVLHYSRRIDSSSFGCIGCLSEFNKPEYKNMNVQFLLLALTSVDKVGLCKQLGIWPHPVIARLHSFCITVFARQDTIQGRCKLGSSTIHNLFVLTLALFTILYVVCLWSSESNVDLKFCCKMELGSHLSVYKIAQWSG